MTQQHRGAKPPGPFSTSPDRRILELDEALRASEVISGAVPAYGFTRDAGRNATLAAQRLGQSGLFATGVVIHAIPYLHSYKVQMGSGFGWMPCCLGTDTGLVPCGPRTINLIPPNSQVVVYIPPGSARGIILCVIPPTLTDGRITCPDWISQGGQSGFKREAAHMFPLTGMYQQGGMYDLSANRPLDGTAFERGWISHTGLALTIDDRLIQLRVHEMCGLWASYWDGWLRLAGLQLLIESSIHTDEAGDDEGEARHVRGEAIYPWEALGFTSYQAQQSFVQQYEAKAVQYSIAKGDTDLPDGKEDLRPIQRYVEYGGYLGQGHLRALLAPNTGQEQRQYGDRVIDECLFREAIGLDGAFSLISAKRVHIGKRVKNVMPLQIHLPPDANGDDATANNYRFSGMFGTGPEHKVKDLQLQSPMHTVAAVQEVLAYVANWQALHPFAYHIGDYYTPQESEQDETFERGMDVLDFANGTNSAMAPPIARKLHIDHRYGDVSYFQRESFFILHDDGSVQLGCGYGAQIVFSQGDITLEAPGKVKILPGTDLVALADQCVIRAKGSVDVSSGEDLRLKASRNMQLLAGNSGEGGMLLECRSSGNLQEYRNRIGEDVRSTGIVFLARNSVIATLSQNVYLRTGGEGLGGGDILLDAGQGDNHVQCLGQTLDVFVQDSLQVFCGPHGSNSHIAAVHAFGASHSVIGGDLFLSGAMTGYGASGITVDGDIYATGSIAAAGVVADKNGSTLGKTPKNFGNQLQTTVSGVAQLVKPRLTDGETTHRKDVVEKYYGELGLGNSDLLDAIGFSYRDADDASQYRTAKLRWLETRWQQLARFGLGDEGVQWVEEPVSYQGRQLHPWPGKNAWLGQPTFLRLSELTLYDPEAGCSVDRPGLYQTGVLADLEAVTMAEGYKLVR